MATLMQFKSLFQYNKSEQKQQLSSVVAATEKEAIPSHFPSLSLVYSSRFLRGFRLALVGRLVGYVYVSFSLG